MAEITHYRPHSDTNTVKFARVPDLQTYLGISSWLELNQHWRLGDATKFFKVAEHEGQNSMSSAVDSKRLDSGKSGNQHSTALAMSKEPTSVLDLPSSCSVSLSSQHSMNSVSDGISKALQTVADQLLSDEQDSAHPMQSATPETSNMLMDQDVMTWMSLTRGSDHSASDMDPVPDWFHKQPERLDLNAQQYYCSKTGLDFHKNPGTMERICNNLPSSHHHYVAQPFKLISQAQLTMSETAGNQQTGFFDTSTSSNQRAFQQCRNVKAQGATLMSMIDGTGAITGSQLLNSTVVPTPELWKLLSSQHDASPQCGNQGPPNKQAPITQARDQQNRSTSLAIPTQQPQPQLPYHFGQTLYPGVTPQDQETGIHMVHLLLACAEAVDMCQSATAGPMLARLRSIYDPEGEPMRRIALYFAEALFERLTIEMNRKQSSHHGSCVRFPEPEVDSAASPSLECDIAYQAYYQILPFKKFTHLTANQALLEGVANYPRVHIIDFNIRQGLQWPSFIQSLAMLPRGPPQLKFTAVQTDAATVQKTGNRLAEFARTMHVPFEFYILEESVESFHQGMISPRAEEALAVNCSDMLHRLLRKEGKLTELLGKIRSLQPVVVTVLEVDANHNEPSFMPRFVHALHYYCAVFDSLEAALLRNSLDRLRIENHCFSTQIRSIIALEDVDREIRHVRAETWQSHFLQAGFRAVTVSRYAADQAQLLLGLYKPSDRMPFTLSSGFGGLSLGWRETPVVAVSSWTFSPPPY